MIESTTVDVSYDKPFYDPNSIPQIETILCEKCNTLQYCGAVSNQEARWYTNELVKDNWEYNEEFGKVLKKGMHKSQPKHDMEIESLVKNAPSEALLAVLALLSKEQEAKN